MSLSFWADGDQVGFVTRTLVEGRTAIQEHDACNLLRVVRVVRVDVNWMIHL